MNKTDALAHIPHLPVKPFIGHTKDALDDFLGLVSRSTRECGEVYRVNLLGRWRIHFTTPEAVEFLMTNPCVVAYYCASRKAIFEKRFICRCIIPVVM